VIKFGASAASLAVSLAMASLAFAQAIAPLHVGGPAEAAMRQLRPPSASEQVREQSMKRSGPLPLPDAPSQEWVAERRVFSPELQREVVIPGHYEQRVSGQQYVAPPLHVYDVQSGTSVALPGGPRPAPDSRPGP
jgi:hypothetical protein